MSRKWARDIKTYVESFQMWIQKKMGSSKLQAWPLSKKNEQWLQNTLKFALGTIGKPGRPSKEFGESSDRSKRRKTKGLRDTLSTEELTYAPQMSQRVGG